MTWSPHGDDDELASLLTESVDPRYARLDTLGVADIARLMNEADGTVPEAVAAAMPQIVPAIEAIAGRLGREDVSCTWGPARPAGWASSTRQSVRPRSTPSPGW